MNISKFLKFFLISPKSLASLYSTKKKSNLKNWLANKLVYFRSNVKNSDGILLVQLVEDFHFTIKLAACSKVISEKYHLNVKFYENKIFISKKYKYIDQLFNFLNLNSINYIYNTFGNEIIFKNSTLFNNQQIISSSLSKIKDELLISGLDGLLNLKFDNILVGDLINDTYLRFYSKTTIEEIDEDVINIIEISLNIFYNFKAAISSIKIKCLLTTYTTYIQHGIVVRMCLTNGISVYCVGYFNFVLQKLTLKFPYHQINHTLFNNDTEISDSNLLKAKSIFTSRFEGIIDNATSYMRYSTYNNKLIDPELRKKFSISSRNIVIYAHDFFDSPHINRNLFFSDFFKYISYVLETVNDLSNVSIFIKVHPNGINGSEEILVNLVNSFNNKNFYILDTSVSNNQIVDLKPDLVCTARGTVGFEMAYFEIPTIALFDNIYSNFNFVHTCKSIDEYTSLLRGEIKPAINFEKNNIYKCYYYAFLNKLPKDDDIFFESINKIKINQIDDLFIKTIKEKNILENTDKILSIYKNALEEEDKITSYFQET